MNRFTKKMMANRRKRNFVKFVIFAVIILFVVDLFWKSNSSEEMSELNGTDDVHIGRKFYVNEDEGIAQKKSIIESLKNKLLGPGNEIYEEKKERYNVKKKMYAEMGLRPREWSIFQVENKTEHGYAGNPRVGNYQFLAPAKVILDLPPSLKPQEFVKPPDIFMKTDLGENGEAVEMPQELSPDIKKIVVEGWEKHQFNKYLSDLISVQRKLPDFRGDYCEAMESKYSKNLPKTSVIIIYNNEAWSTLLRSVHSVLDRSPDHLIEEVLLVDDFSDMDHLKQPLDDYMANYPKVRILRAEKREGLIKARIRGTLAAKAPTLTFLDSHIECTTGWLEPLLDRIAQSSFNVPCPIIEMINDTTFQYKAHKTLSKMQVGGFDWRLNFNWHVMDISERKKRNDTSEPVKSPTMAGGLFSIDKAFFMKLGMYDPELQFWGAENLELSFKTWMCGGIVEIVPCSHVGHIFREKSPYEYGKNTVKINKMRLAEVWMDEYAHFFYFRTGSKKENIGDISERVKLRQDLNCKSFKWYMNTVFPEQFDPTNGIAYGEIRNVDFGNKTCLEVQKDKKGSPATLYTCHESGGNQYWEYYKGVLRRDNYYLTRELVLGRFHSIPTEKLWSYNITSMQLYQKKKVSCSKCARCLTMNADRELHLNKCDGDLTGQQWQLQNLNPTKVQEF